MTTQKTASTKIKEKIRGKKKAGGVVSDPQPVSEETEAQVPEKGVEDLGGPESDVPVGFGSEATVPRMALRKFDLGEQDAGGNPVHPPELTEGLDRPGHRLYDAEGRPQG